jgi:cobalamin-independent methionine synthase catalytic subunit
VTESAAGTSSPAPVLIGGATGIGSWPGDDVVAAVRASFDELGEAPHLPYLPELPARGPGADMIGRSAALLVDLPVDLQPSGWRLVDHPGRDHQRAVSWLRQDLDVLAEVADGYEGLLKLQVTGPWTLAAQLWLPRLERVVVDPGAVRDLIASLAEGVARHVAEVRRLLPGASMVLQVDEPSLDAVLAGSLPTASGFGRLRSVEEPVVVDGLRSVLEAATAAGASLTAVHSCASAPPVSVLARVGAGALSLDVRRLGSAAWESIAVAVEDGTRLWAGVVPSAGTPGTRPDEIADQVWSRWRKLGLAPALAGGVMVTPVCGLAGAPSPASAVAALRLARSAASVLAERSLD